METIAALRRLLLGVLTFGLVGTSIELVLLKHYEDAWMLAPFAVMSVALVAAAARLLAPAAWSVRCLQAAMILLLVAGGIGSYLHYEGGLSFQVDMDPTLSRWQLFWKVVRMQAPPTLAPGVLVQLALVGLVSTYRDPLLERDPVLESDARSFQS
jgi:hypothetical protein